MTVPAAGSSSPAMACSSVDLPEPFGPTSDVTPARDREVARRRRRCGRRVPAPRPSATTTAGGWFWFPFPATALRILARREIGSQFRGWRRPGARRGRLRRRRRRRVGRRRRRPAPGRRHDEHPRRHRRNVRRRRRPTCEVIMPVGADPHEFAPSTRQAEAMHGRRPARRQRRRLRAGRWPGSSTAPRRRPPCSRSPTT